MINGYRRNEEKFFNYSKFFIISLINIEPEMEYKFDVSLFNVNP